MEVTANPTRPTLQNQPQPLPLKSLFSQKQWRNKDRQTEALTWGWRFPGSTARLNRNTIFEPWPSDVRLRVYQAETQAAHPPPPHHLSLNHPAPSSQPGHVTACSTQCRLCLVYFHGNSWAAALAGAQMTRCDVTASCPGPAAAGSTDNSGLPTPPNISPRLSFTFFLFHPIICMFQISFILISHWD